jgi:hypothetical protein
MDGLNHAYKVSPTNYMKNNVLTMNPSIVGSTSDPRELVTGLQHFDIRPLPYKGGSELKFFMDSGQVQHVGERIVGSGGRFNDSQINSNNVSTNPTKQSIGVIWHPAKDEKPVARENPILAYWLPYEADKTYEVVLGAAANYFFTAGLSGCSVMVSGDPTAPRVAHINRTETGSPKFQAVVANNMELEEALAKQHARAYGDEFVSRTGKEAQTSRQFLFQELKTAVDAKQANRDTSNDVLGYCKWGEQYTSLTVVFGVRNAGTGAWAFYYQNYRNDEAPSEHAKLGFITSRDGDLMRFA